MRVPSVSSRKHDHLHSHFTAAVSVFRAVHLSVNRIVPLALAQGIPRPAYEGGLGASPVADAKGMAGHDVVPAGPLSAKLVRVRRAHHVEGAGGDGIWLYVDRGETIAQQCRDSYRYVTRDQPASQRLSERMGSIKLVRT